MLKRKGTVVKKASQYVVTFLVYSVLGYCFEKYIVKKELCPPKVACLPFLPIYGFGALLLAVMNDILNKATEHPLLNFLFKLLTAIVVLAVFECAAGKFSKRLHNGVQTWKYEHCACCEGYVSLESVSVWTLGAAAFFLADPVRLVFNALP
jgi:uncharacterized membrane protein